MKKLLIIGIVLAAAGGVFLALNPFPEAADTVHARHEMNKSAMDEGEMHSCCSDIGEGDELAENSVYQLTSEWTDQRGNAVKLSDFRGKDVIMTMFFASCTYACPILVEDMRRIEAELPEDKLQDYRFLLVSIDPERDTAAKLKEFAERVNIDESRWTLLTSGEDNIMELAAVTGFKYKKEKDGQFSHSNIINILNRQGEITYQQKGLNQDVAVAANYLTNPKEL